MSVIYDSRITPEFVLECAKIGMVEVSTRQVTISSRGSIDMEKLFIPGWFIIEWVGLNDGFIQITLGVKQ